MKKSFRSTASNVLTAHGFTQTNAPGELARDEPDDFNLAPGKWRLVDGEWMPYGEEITKWDQIKAERDRRKSGGVMVSVDGVDKWFHSDDASRIQQIALVMFGAAVPPVQWKTMDGTFVGMTQALANQIFQTAAASDQAIFAKAEEHRIAMEASADPETYDFSTGWPLTYGE